MNRFIRWSHNVLEEPYQFELEIVYEMSAKLLIALTLTLTYVVTQRYVDASSLRKTSPPDDVRANELSRADTVVKRSVRGHDDQGSHRKSSGSGVHSVPIMARHGSRPVAEAWDLLGDDERSQFTSLLADALLLEHLRNRRPAGQPRREVWSAPYNTDLMTSLGETESRDGGRLARLGLTRKRTIGHLRSPRELHPVYLGLGQDAASAALNTYASLLADEKRRESLEQQQQGSANPVRFIGKR